MRVIAGSAKGRRLQSRDGADTRPTTDQHKESLFAMLQFQVPGSRFLDLFAGSGSIGIEALSRGAVQATFVEENRKAASCIRDNLAITGFSSSATLLQKDVFTAIRELGHADARFDIIFLDPPYDRDLEMKTLFSITETGILAPEGLVVVESSSKTEITAPGSHLTVERVRDYKLTRFTFLQSNLETLELI